MVWGARQVLLAKCGYRVFAGGRDAEKLNALDRFAREHKLSLESIQLDVCDDDSANRAVSEIEHHAGPVDILINNAGIAILGAMEEITLDDLRKQFETNVFGSVRMSKRVLPAMRQRRRLCCHKTSRKLPNDAKYLGANEGSVDVLRSAFGTMHL
jgi:NADP-dependent 3-hydroxy acid dehydrogenase YdfG